MRCVRVTNEVDAWAVIHRIEQKCNLSSVFGDEDMSREDLYDMFMYKSIIFKFMSDNYSRVYATAILQHSEEGEAHIHFSMFSPVHILRGFELLKEEIKGEIHTLHSYIRTDRKDMFKLLSLLGFKMSTTKDGYYYGISKKSS